jgi:hypothetical protein
MGASPGLEREPQRDLREFLKEFIELEGEYVAGKGNSVHAMLADFRTNHPEDVTPLVEKLLRESILRLAQFDRLYEKLFQQQFGISEAEWESVLAESTLDQWHKRDAAEGMQP